jgi:short-subunit dehydrogenase
LINNAGFGLVGRFAELPPERQREMIDLNVRTLTELCRLVLPGMLERGRGHLVYISSISGKVATTHAALYNATKFGLRGFSFAMHEDLRGTGVGCTTVFPGFIEDAGMWADSNLDAPPGSGARKPEDVSKAVLKAIAKNPREIDVAGLIPRSGGWMLGIAPGLVSALQRSGGGDKTTAALSEAQKAKR